MTEHTLGIIFSWSSAAAGLYYYVALDIWLHCLIPSDTILYYTNTNTPQISLSLIFIFMFIF